MLRRIVLLPLVLVTLASVGCCTCSPRMYCGGGCGPCGGGCGERYVHEFISDPPCCGDPCDGCGNYNGGCRGCVRPFCLLNLRGLIGMRCDCGSCGGGCATGGCGCGGGGCDSCGGGSAGGYVDGGYADAGPMHGGQFVQEHTSSGPQMNHPAPQTRSVMTPRPAPQMAPRPAAPSPTARKPIQGKTTGMPRTPMQRTGNVRLMSYEDEANVTTEAKASAGAQTISHRAAFVR